MPRQEAKLEINQFTGGLNTDATELTTPENTSVDEDNFDLLKEGTRRRRRGMDLESATVTTLTTDGPTMFVSNHRWESVAKQGGLSFEVIQTGSTLRFYDTSSNPLVSGVKAFTVDLDTFRAPFATRTDTVGISVASGKGVLFVSGEAINPFYIEYDVDNDTISTTQLNLKIRDLTQLDTTDAETQSATITSNRKYDLLNQGWYQEDVIIGSSSQVISIKTKSKNPDTTIPGYDGSILEGYKETFGVYPPKTKPWWIGRGTVTVDVHIKKPGIFNDKKYSKEVEAFSKEAFDLYFGGNTVAPLGHYIVDPFYKDRAAASGVSGLAPETTNKRPNAVAFYGGRAIFALNNTIYFSQVILDDLTAAERCYQDADPTAEDTIGLIASDGGVITIPDMGDVIRLVVLEGALLIFADNGVWSLYSPQGRGFSAIDFTVDYVTSLNATGYHSIVDVEGNPVYWGDKGVYLIQPAAERIAYNVVDLSDKKIKNYIETISPLAKKYAKGAYDLTNKRVIWLWKSSVDPNNNRFLFDRVLNYSTVFDAFFPYSVAIHTAGDGSDKDKAVCGIVRANSFATSTGTETVVIDEGDALFDNVDFYYPLSTVHQYADLGPVGHADATATAAGTIITEANLPLGSGYNNPTTTAGANQLTIAQTATPSMGTSDWTFDFWVHSDNWIFAAFQDAGIIHFQRGAANEPLIHLRAATPTTATAYDLVLIMKSDDGTTFSTDVPPPDRFTADSATYFISITRSGNNLYYHIDGVLIDTFDVTGKSFNFNTGAGNGTYEILGARAGQDDSSVPGTVGELRWTSVARYSASSYTPPTNTTPKVGGGIVTTTSDGNVFINVRFVTESAIGLKYIVLQNSTQTTTAAELGFGDFTDTAFKDWNSTTFGDDYTSYIETFYHLTDDSMTYLQAPWVYAYIKRSSTTFPAAEGDGSIASGDVGGAWTGA